MKDDPSPAFGNPVADAQACFRALLDAMARPGRTYSVHGVSAPAPLCNAAAAALLTLTDHQTPLWLDPNAAGARPWISFHTGAPLKPIGNAVFAMALSLPDLAELPHGTDETPETSATVILQISALTAGRRFVLEGPGLRHPTGLRVAGLPADFASIWERNHRLFPRGVDLILCAGNQLTALPRSVSVREA
jgi:alpha-D-ribose 1-methylphosphonate 5-triphosphate synthase subunit PhnH